MIGVLDTCECGREFLRGIYPQKKCPVCDVMITHFKLSEVLSLREIRELPVILDSEGNMELIKEEK